MQKQETGFGDVSHAIGEFIEKNGYSVVREFQGHGIGRQMHEDPGIPNYGKAGHGIKLEPRYDTCNRANGNCRKIRNFRAR